MSIFQDTSKTKSESYSGFGTRFCRNKYYTENLPKISQEWVDKLSEEQEKAIMLHRQYIPSYHVTKHVSLPGLARRIGVKSIYIKDESSRFGLNSFKGLGGSYAVFKQMENAWKKSFNEPFPISQFLSSNTPNEIKNKVNVTFCAATDGNHGRSVAWSSSLFGQKCIIYLPKGTAQFRVDNIRKLGAEVIELDMDYDQTVLYANSISKEKGYILVSDTAVNGEEEVPCQVMAGYRTLFAEIEDQMKSNEEKHDIRPTHVFLQAGVGGLAAAGASHWIYSSQKSGIKFPKMIVVEPLDADCFLTSCSHGEMTNSEGNISSIMNGLNCGTCSTVAWEVLRFSISLFIAIGDEFAREAVRILCHPLDSDIHITSGESGVSGLAGLLAMTLSPNLAKLREEIGLDHNSVVSIVSSEGDTDPELYQKLTELHSRLDI